MLYAIVIIISHFTVHEYYNNIHTVIVFFFNSNLGDSTSTATRFSEATHIGILLLGCCFVGVCAMAVVYAKRLAANVRGRSVFRERPTVRIQNGEEIRFTGSKGVEERPVVTS